MSKKIWSTNGWKHQCALRQRKSNKRTRRTPLSPVVRDVRRRFRQRGLRRLIKLTAPAHLSLLENSEETLEYFAAIREMYTLGEHVFVRLDDVRKVGAEAIAALAATIQFHQGTCLTRGNLPIDPIAREAIISSGMLAFTDFTPSPGYLRSGVMKKRNSRRVEVKTAQSMVHYATEAAFGQRRKSQASYRALIEGMQNTYDHADLSAKGNEAWLIAVFADSVKRVATFTLLDNGVGIFESVNLRAMRATLRMLGITDNTDVLKDILERKVLSSTGLPYRGRGLPGFRDAADRGSIHNVTIISNDVFANLSSGEYRTLTTAFGGTVLYWEIRD